MSDRAAFGSGSPEGRRSISRPTLVAIVASTVAILVVAIWALGGSRGPATETPTDPWVRIVVIHTNDVHGNLLPRTPALAMVEADGPVGGIAALASYVKTEREAAVKSGAHVLLLDGGDVWRGTPEGDLTRGDLVIAAFSLLEYDAVALGNHDLDFGVENAARLAKASTFPWLAANVTDRTTGEPPNWLKRSVVLDVDGVRVGVIGMSPSDTASLVMNGDKLGLAFGDEVEAAKAQAKALEGRADVILFLTHLGPERDRNILAALPTVPLIVGGHSHTRLARPILAGPANKAWIVQAGTACVIAGRVVFRVERRTHEVVLEDSSLTPLVVSKVGTEPLMSTLLDSGLKSVPALKPLSETVAMLDAELPREGASPDVSSPAGNAYADAMRRAAGETADVALANRGGIRVRLPKGPVTGRDLFLLMPFENTLVELTLSGAELRAAIARSLGGRRGSPLEVSGMRARWRRKGEGDARTIEFTTFDVGGRPLDETKRYRVIVNSFLAGGGDGYAEFANRPDAKDLNVLVRDALRAHFTASPIFHPDATERMGPAAEGE